MAIWGSMKLQIIMKNRRNICFSILVFPCIAILGCQDCQVAGLMEIRFIFIEPLAQQLVCLAFVKGPATAPAGCYVAIPISLSAVGIAPWALWQCTTSSMNSEFYRQGIYSKTSATFLIQARPAITVNTFFQRVQNERLTIKSCIKGRQPKKYVRLSYIIVSLGPTIYSQKFFYNT